ncbi:MAG: class I SAM-dependent methyltransferase [Bacteroidota bacterium]
MYTKTTFDVIADTYDKDFTKSIIGSLQRKKVWHYLTKYLPQKNNLQVLEINCGTGEDAVWLAQLGHHVTATDLSSQMITIAKNKAIQTNNIQFEVNGFDTLITSYKQQQFDVVFSNFAGLNCINKDALTQLNKDLAALLKPNGQLIIVLLGKYCLLERLYFLFRSEFKKINRRKQKATAYLSDNNYQDTWCYSYKELQTIFSAFKLKRKRPIGLFIPPSYLEETVKKHRTILYLLKFFDSLFGNISLLSNYGDHIILQLEKK